MARMTPASIRARLLRIHDAWKRLRRTKAYAGLTVEQYRRAIQPSLDIREEIADLQARLAAALTRRDILDREALATSHRVRFGVTAEEPDRDDGELYAAMGFVRRSRRKRRSRRNSKSKQR